MSGFRSKIGTVGNTIAVIAAGLSAVSCSRPTVPSDPGVALVAREPTPESVYPVMVRQRNLESQVVAEINHFRAQHGRAPFARHRGLDGLAEDHSRRMAGQGTMSHAGFSKRVERARGRYGMNRTAENVMWGSGYAESTLAQTIVKGWIESGGHRKNLLRANTRIGIGIARGSDGSVWATQLSARTD